MAVASLDQNDRAVGDAERGARVLLDEQNRDAARPDLGELGEDGLNELGRQAGGGLVEHQHGGRNDERAGDRHHLALAARQATGRQMALAGEIGKEGVDRGDALGARGRRDDARRQAKIVLDAHAREHVLGLRHESEAATDEAMGGEAGDIRAVEPHRPRLDRRQAGDRLDQRRLARAVGTEHRDDLARCDAQRRAVDDRHAGIVAGDEIAHLERGAHARLPPR